MQGHPQLRLQNQFRALQLAVDNRKPYVPFKQDECLGWSDSFMSQLPVLTIEQVKDYGWTLLTDVDGPPSEIRESLHHALLIAGSDHKDIGVTKNQSGGILVWIRPSVEAPAQGAA